jgi:hypothetical protein
VDLGVVRNFGHTYRKSRVSVAFEFRHPRGKPETFVQSDSSNGLANGHMSCRSACIVKLSTVGSSRGQVVRVCHCHFSTIGGTAEILLNTNIGSPFLWDSDKDLVGDDAGERRTRINDDGHNLL